MDGHIVSGKLLFKSCWFIIDKSQYKYLMKIRSQLLDTYTEEWMKEYIVYDVAIMFAWRQTSTVKSLI